MRGPNSLAASIGFKRCEIPELAERERPVWILVCPGCEDYFKRMVKETSLRGHHDLVFAGSSRLLPSPRYRFQATSMEFPTGGCWEVTAEAGDRELRFITHVESSTAH